MPLFYRGCTNFETVLSAEVDSKAMERHVIGHLPLSSQYYFLLVICGQTCRSFGLAILCSTDECKSEKKKKVNDQEIQEKETGAGAAKLDLEVLRPVRGRGRKESSGLGDWGQSGNQGRKSEKEKEKRRKRRKKAVKE